MTEAMKRRQQQYSIDTVAAIAGTLLLVAGAMWLSTIVGSFLTFVIGVAFVLSGKQRVLFGLIARIARKLMRVRDADTYESEDLGVARGGFKRRPSLPFVIEHDPNEFNRRRG